LAWGLPAVTCFGNPLKLLPLPTSSFAGESTGPWTKIGYSANPPEWRMDANLKHGNPNNIHVAAAFEYPTSDEAWAAEKNTHRNFAHRMHQKEWFRVNWEEVSAWLQGQGGRLRKAPINDSENFPDSRF
jgi:hypothetical protein